MKKFKIGFETNDVNFQKNIFAEFNENEIKDSGLFYFDQNKKKHVSRFRERVIFPIRNITGEIIAIGGRILKESKYSAKYINSPETPFFKKGSNLFNLDSARKLSNSLNNIFLVEGYMDVIGLSKNKIDNVVANLGTSLTTRQILSLNQFFDEIVICFDGDESGYKAALRAAENSIIELKPEKKISFLFLPDNHDPDSFVNEKGRDFFLDYSQSNSVSIHKFIFDHYLKNMDDSPSSRAIFEKKVKIDFVNYKRRIYKEVCTRIFLRKDFSIYSKYKFKI